MREGWMLFSFSHRIKRNRTAQQSMSPWQNHALFESMNYYKPDEWRTMPFCPAFFVQEERAMCLREWIFYHIWRLPCLSLK